MVNVSLNQVHVDDILLDLVNTHSKSRLRLNEAIRSTFLRSELEVSPLFVEISQFLPCQYALEK